MGIGPTQAPPIFVQGNARHTERAKLAWSGAEANAGEMRIAKLKLMQKWLKHQKGIDTFCN